MVKRSTAFMLFQLLFILAQGQSKLNTHLLKLLSKGTEKEYTFLIRADVEKLQRVIAGYNGIINYSTGDISSVTVPLRNVKQLSNEVFVQRIELSNQKLTLMDDSSLRKNNILKVHSGTSPLTSSYTGKGVLIGIIDSGTDIDHRDFKDSAGNTRIKWLWDQRLVTATNTPQPYNYGQEWNSAAIDSGTCTHDDNADMSHGTKVAGIAAGNGATASQYKGIAPDANLISVALNFGHQGPIITDAINYIVQKANTLGMPVVINISLGDYYGSHDGKDLESQFIDSLLGNTPGRALVAAAGNAGEVPFHLGYNTSNTDTNFTWVSGGAVTNFQVYADSADFKNVKFRVGAFHDTSYTYKGHTPFNVIDSVQGILRTDTLKLNNNILAVVETAGDFYQGVYALDVTIITDSTNLLWSFETNGTGKIDAWSFEFVSSGLPSSTLIPAMAKYKRPDTLQTICGGFQCSKKVIAVGNYTNRLGFNDVTSTFTTFPGTDNDIFPTSSLGPTRDNRIKPEVSAGGENIATTGALPILTWLIANFPHVVTHDSMHMIFGGSSASAPVVAGLAALYFEKYPGATTQQLRNDIINCAKKDIYTGTVPNNLWGYGKLDGFGALICSMPSTVGMEERKINDKPEIYPNPTSGDLVIETLYFPEVLVLADLMGRELKQLKVTQSSQKFNIGELKNGIYILKSQHHATKIVVNK